MDLAAAMKALNEQGFIWTGEALGYFNADRGRFISIQWIESHSVAELLGVASKRPTESFEFVFNEPPSENVKRQLRAKLAVTMSAEQLLRAVRRIAGCSEGESVIEKVLQLYEKAQDARRSPRGREGNSLRDVESKAAE